MEIKQKWTLIITDRVLWSQFWWQGMRRECAVTGPLWPADSVAESLGGADTAESECTKHTG